MLLTRALFPAGPILVTLACASQPPPAPAAPAAPPSTIAEDAPAIPASAFETPPGVGTPLGSVAPPQGPTLPPPADVAAPPADAERSPTGLASKKLAPGAGREHPAEVDKVKVHYTGWSTDGKMFDSSVVRGEPTEFPLANVIKGWSEGVRLMVVGEKRRFWIPPALAYGDPPQHEAVPHGTLVFDVELLSITKGIAPPPVPEDVAGPPRGARKTPSGLAYRVLRRGRGHVHPQADSRVKVHYAGWTTDGTLFDSSIPSGEPVTFRVGEVVPGFGEGLRLMVPGEKTRLWIPPALGYGATPPPGAPAGMLVFDVELLAIE